MNINEWKLANPNRSINEYYSGLNSTNQTKESKSPLVNRNLPKNQNLQIVNTAPPPVSQHQISYANTTNWDKNLPLFVRNELSNWPVNRQSEFLEEYSRKKKSVGLAYLLWFMVGWHYAYVGKWGLLALYILSVGGFFIWMLIDIFRVPGIVREYNRDLATKTLMNMQAITAYRY